MLQRRSRVAAVTCHLSSTAVPAPPQAMQAEEALLDDGRFLKQQLQALLQVRPQGFLRHPVKLGPHPCAWDRLFQCSFWGGPPNGACPMDSFIRIRPQQ